jgi:hypothetical protein
VNNIPCNADDNACTVGDTCFLGSCRPGDRIVCEADGQCKLSVCNTTTAQCDVSNLPEDTPCNDANQCTTNDRCIDGQCIGDLDEQLAQTIECGYVPSIPSFENDPTNIIIIFVLSGAGALVGAIVGLAFLVKKVRDSRLMDPDTWNPDAFSSVGANPLYQSSSRVVDNRLYENN